MAKAWGPDVEAESQKDQDADALAARRSERAGRPGAREADASEDSRIGAEGNSARVPSCAAGQSRRHRGGDNRVRGKSLTVATRGAGSRLGPARRFRRSASSTLASA